VPVMDNQLGTLIPADFPGVLNGILLPVKVLDGAFATTLFDVPSAAASTWNDMMSLSGHALHPLLEGLFLLTTWPESLKRN